MVDRKKHMPLYVQLHDILIEKIKKGVWDVETQIPTEKALMEEYNIGRVTVREALSMLVNEGYLYKKHGIGTFVARKKSSLGFEPLISLTYSLEAKGVNARNDIVEKRMMTPNKKFLAKLKWESKRQCCYLKRVRYAESTPIAIEDSYFSNEFKDVISRFDLTGSIAKIILEDLKISIKKVEQVVVQRTATKEEQETLKLDEEAQVLDLERWIYAGDSMEPIYYLNFVILENIYSLKLENL